MQCLWGVECSKLICCLIAPCRGTFRKWTFMRSRYVRCFHSILLRLLGLYSVHQRSAGSSAFQTPRRYQPASEPKQRPPVSSSLRQRPQASRWLQQCLLASSKHHPSAFRGPPVGRYEAGSSSILQLLDWKKKKLKSVRAEFR